jgi:hypothetical protein
LPINQLASPQAAGYKVADGLPGRGVNDSLP